jgi:hypothetical protein
VVVGDQGPFDRCADQPVVPDGCVQGEQPLDDPGPQPGGDASAVAFETKLVLERPDDCLDALAQPVWEVPGLLLIFAGRADQGELQVVAGEEFLGFFSGQALVRDHAVPGAGRLAGWCSSICRACWRSPKSLGLASANPVTVPSQVHRISSLAPQYQREWLGQYPYPAQPYRSERRAVTAEAPHGTGVASISRSSSAAGGRRTGQPPQRGLHQQRRGLEPGVVLALAQQPREQVPDQPRRGAQSVPLVIGPQQDCATARHTSSSSVTSGRPPGPRRASPRSGMMRSVSSTYSAIRRVSRPAITDGLQGPACVRTPIPDTLHISVTDHVRCVASRLPQQARNPGQRSG